jgi:hypothetical protein
LPDIPQAAITAAAAAIERELMSGTDYSMAAGSDEALARAALEAAAPVLAETVAAKILAHMEARGPKEGFAGSLGSTLRRAWRRHFGIAARIAAWAFTAEDEKKQLAAEAMARGDFTACREHGHDDQSGGN